jgi:hypothetical protein
VSERDPPDLVIPFALEGGAFANDVYVYPDVEYTTIDFVRLAPDDPSVGVLVARVTAPPSCILILRERLKEPG